MQEVMLTIKKMVPIRTMNYRRIDRTVAGHIRPIRYICTPQSVRGTSYRRRRQRDESAVAADKLCVLQAEEFTLNLGWPLCPCQPAQWKLQIIHASVTAVSADRSVEWAGTLISFVDTVVKTSIDSLEPLAAQGSFYDNSDSSINLGLPLHKGKINV